MAETAALADAIERIWARMPTTPEDDDRRAVAEAMTLVDSGRIRAAELTDDTWTVNRWVKQALDLYYRSSQPTLEQEAGPLQFRDRFPLKRGLAESQIRLGPPGAARYGSFASPGATLAACYLHLGVWVGEGSLIDAWVALGTCAQIGARVKSLPCTSVVGSLYPIDTPPAVIEDDCHIGSGCVIGPGTRVDAARSSPPGSPSARRHAWSTSPERPQSRSAVTCPRTPSSSPGASPCARRRRRPASRRRS